jgi:hypothetical protein
MEKALLKGHFFLSLPLSPFRAFFGTQSESSLDVQYRTVNIPVFLIAVAQSPCL